MEDYDEFVKEHLLSEDFVAKRLKRLRVLTEPTPEKLLRDLRRHTNHNELRIVESVTSAKNKLQRKYYSKKKLEVQSIDESIDDPVDFDRRLKLFLHRRNKLGLLSFLDSNPPSKKKPDHGMIVESKEFDQLRRIIDPRWKQSSHKRIDCTVIRTQNTSPLKLKRQPLSNKRYRLQKSKASVSLLV